MTAPTVRPAVACVAWVTSSVSVGVVGDGRAKPTDDYRATVLDGKPDQIAARVREAVLYSCESPWHEAGDGDDHHAACEQCIKITARVLAALGITTEASNAG